MIENEEHCRSLILNQTKNGVPSVIPSNAGDNRLDLRVRERAPDYPGVSTDYVPMLLSTYHWRGVAVGGAMRK